LYYSKNCIVFGVAVLHGGFGNGVQLGKIVGTVVCPEAAADFLFYLYLPHTSLAGIIVIGHMQVREESEKIAFCTFSVKRYSKKFYVFANYLNSATIFL